MYSRAKGTIRRRGKSWEVDFPKLSPRYRRSWPTEAEAIRDRERKQRQLGGVGLPDSILRSFEAANYRLTTAEPPFQGKSIDFVVDFFFQNYRGKESSQTLHEYGEEYKLRKEQQVEDKSYTEIRLHIDHFLKDFGHQKPVDVKAAQIERYLAANTSRYYRDKTLRAFFRWLTGRGGSKRVTPLEDPPLEKNPFDFVTKVEYEKKHATEILTGEEIRALVERAQLLEVLPWVVWMLFSGMRPDAEARPYWTAEGHGWKRIDMERGLICVTDDLEKTGARVRDITIEPNFREWLDWMKNTGQVPVYSRCKMRKLFQAVIPYKRHQDIFRHSWISYSLKFRRDSDICYEGATSMKMIQKHYRRQIPEPDVTYFRGLTPKSLGLP